MNLNDLLAQHGQSLGQLGQQFGFSPEQTQQALGALAPQLGQMMQGQGAAGAGGLLGALGGLGSLLSGGQADALAQQVAQKTGLDPQMLQQLVPAVLSLISGQSSGNAGGLGGLASMLDANKDGNVIDDVARLAGGFFGGKR